MSFDRLAWNRAWRKRNRAALRVYDASRPARARHSKRASRAAYFRKWRAAHRTPTIRIRIARFSRRKTEQWRAGRERLVIASIQAEQEEMLANTSPELAKLIAAQARDAASFQIRRSALFIPQARADALLYGTSYPFELG